MKRTFIHQAGKIARFVSLTTEEKVFPDLIRIPYYALQVIPSLTDDSLYTVEYNALKQYTIRTKKPREFERASEEVIGYFHTAVVDWANQQLVCAMSTDNILYYDLNGKYQRFVKCPRSETVINCLALSADGKYLLAGTGHLNSQETTIEVFREGEWLRTLVHPQLKYGVKSVCWVGHTLTFVTASQGVVQFWHVDGHLLTSFKQSAAFPGYDFVYVNPEGSRIVTVDYWSGTVAFYEGDGKLIRFVERNPRRFSLYVSANVSSDGAHVLIALRHQLERYTLDGHLVDSYPRYTTREARCISASPNNHTLYVGSTDYLEIYHLSEKRLGLVQTKGVVNKGEAETSLILAANKPEDIRQRSDKVVAQLLGKGYSEAPSADKSLN